MSELLAGAMAVALALYALLGGADFGGGVWDLLASGSRRAEQRARIVAAIGPVWEVNHVWLILAVVLLFSAFPVAFASVSIACHVPLTFLLFGIVLRGAAFTFRAYDPRGDRVERRWGLIFSSSSVFSPWVLGAIVGALAEGVTTGPRSLWAWLTPYSAVVGAFTLSLFAYLAAAYLTAECEPGALRDDFRRRAIGAWVVTGVLSLAVAWMSREAAPQLYAGLTRTLWAAALWLGQAVASLVALWALIARRARLARVMAAGQGALVVLGWVAAQYPNVTPVLSLDAASASPAVQRALLVALGSGVLVLVPSLVLLLRIFKSPGRAEP